MTTPHSDALVFFGATGDLAYKKIFPALQAMIRRGHLEMPVIGIASSRWSLEQFVDRARASLNDHGGLDAGAFAKLCGRLRYIHGDYRDKTTFAKLREILGNVEHPLHYLAIPGSLFSEVADGLANSGCARNARVVVEKPFGRDLVSARELNATLHRFFPEDAIFRIDHYLGKESVQNLIYFRCANPFLEAAWSNAHIESVQITMAENFGVAGRGKFYEEVGAIRDVVQNHMLQVVACLTMELPAAPEHEALRDERGRLLQSMRTLDPAEVVRGQFRGYRQEAGVAPDSHVETYAQLRLHIDSPRWNGVPFYVRSGKCLPVTATEILVRFKRLSPLAIDDPGTRLSNYYRFRLSPEVVIALGTKVKRPGEQMVGERIELVARHQSADDIGPYERLLGDAAAGDATLFAREDSVEAAWRVVDPVLGNKTTVLSYAPGTWGPSEVNRRVVPPDGWHDPDS